MKVNVKSNDRMYMGAPPGEQFLIHWHETHSSHRRAKPCGFLIP